MTSVHIFFHADVNNCTSGLCSIFATCTINVASENGVICTCLSGFSGNGSFCEGIEEEFPSYSKKMIMKFPVLMDTVTLTMLGIATYNSYNMDRSTVHMPIISSRGSTHFSYTLAVLLSADDSV